MKWLSLYLLPGVLLFAPAPLAAQDASDIKTIVIKHFVNSNSTDLSQDFIEYFASGLRAALEKQNVAETVVAEGASVPAADGAQSLVIEGRFTYFKPSSMFALGRLKVDINVFRLSDHALVKGIPAEVPAAYVKDKAVAGFTSKKIAAEIQRALRDVNLTIIPAPAQGDKTSGTAVPSAGPAATPAPAAPASGEQSTKAATPSATIGPFPAAARENPRDRLKYVWISAGTFMMGCSPGDRCDDDQKPLHQVTISKGFWIGQTLVTVGAYKRFAGATGRPMPPEPFFFGPYNPGWANDAMPIVDVTWDDAQGYCSWAGGRLPTEAEWEYAARGGSTQTRYGPIDDIAWYLDNSGVKRLDSTRMGNCFMAPGLLSVGICVGQLRNSGITIHEVGLKQPNSYGLFDMLGNVWEWVNDWYDRHYYRDSPSQDPQGPASGKRRVLRGGAWDSPLWYVAASVRGGGAGWEYQVRPDVMGALKMSKGVDVGFRCVGEVGNPPTALAQHAPAPPVVEAHPATEAATAAAAPQPAPAVPASDLATVAVHSTPDGADITVDGKFVGSTPSSIRLSPGDHTIVLEKSGYKTWQRTMTVTAGATITVGPTLEKKAE